MSDVLARFRTASGGASAVEFALVATPFLLMMFGVVEYGRLLWTHHALTQSAIATARCVALPQEECAGGPAGARDFAQTTAQGWGIRIEPAEIAIETDIACGGIAGFARTQISTTFTTALPEMFLALAGGERIVTSACFPVAAG